ncbi:MAG TPA: phosphatase PAP2 family protein [Chitinophagaceae bacterium]|nr:phosphatase PAP2 family protein [Chitinophagaceae bacterium]
MQSLNYKNFITGLLLSILCALILFILSYSYGKNQFFLLLNTDLGTVADNFFNFFSYLGDGLLWIPLVVYFVYKEGKRMLPLLISSFALTTAFTQACKYLIVPDELRPTAAITNEFIHTVNGVTVHATASFPSGHTATAFVFYLIFCLVFENKLWLVAGLFYALIVGYSRIYLAQHFPFDVAAGIVVAIVSVIFSLLIQNRFSKRKSNNL